MDTTLKYLRESLANYDGNKLSQQISEKLGSNEFSGEGDFVKSLTDEEMAYLIDVLEQEISYARSVQNDQRVTELNEVFELLH
nr:sporulation protein [Virgibacillus siamensis]